MLDVILNSLGLGFINDNYLHEEVYGVRFYNRVLADKEIEQNYLTDKNVINMYHNDLLRG